MTATKEEAPTAPTVEASKVIPIQTKGIKVNSSPVDLFSGAASSAALIPTFTSVIGGQQLLCCDARTLHAFLGVLRDFSNWIKGRIAKFGFVEGEDYIGNIDSPNRANQTRGGDRRSIDYTLTLDMAKELSMVENNEAGRQARRYFLECERRAMAAAPSPQTAVAPAADLTPLWAGVGQMEFEGNTFHLLLINGEPYASMREVARAVGVDAQGQVTRLKAEEAYWRIRVATFPTDGGPQASFAIPAGMVSNWLRSIKHPRVSAAVKEKAAYFSKRLGPAMLAHWWATEGSPANREPLSDPEIRELDMALEQGAMLMGTAGERALFPVQARLLLAKEFGVESHRDIPCTQFVQALAWVTRHTLAVAASPFRGATQSTGARRWVFSLDEDGNEHFERMPADVAHAPWTELVAGVEAGQRQFDEVLGMFQACGKFLQASALALPASPPAPLGDQVKLI